MVNQSNQYVSTPIPNTLRPKEGPKAMNFVFDWTALGSYTIDLQNQQERNFLSMVQTVWIDNSLNMNVFAITFDTINQTIRVAAQSQGYYPVMVINPPRFVAVSTIAAVATKIALINVPIEYATW